MKQLSLGNTSVSALCLGGVWFGTKEDKGTSFRLLDQYADAGGRFVDTANMYAHWFSEKTSGGESETVIGEWLKQRGNRDEFVIATKLGFPYPGVEQGLRACTDHRRMRQEPGPPPDRRHRPLLRTRR